MNITHKLLVRLLAFLTLLFVITTFAFADVIQVNSFQASSNGVNVSVRWITDQEQSVSYFEIQRRSGTDGAFTTIGTINPKGPSLYEFVDNSAFHKVTTLYQYRIVVYFSDKVTAPFYSSAISVSHTVSGVRRTWGSIKAMFR